MVRHTELEIPLLPGNDRDVWLVEARIDLIAEGEPLRVSLDLPDRPPGFRLFTEQAASPGYGFAVLEDNPYEVPQENLKDVEVWGTVVSGIPYPKE